MGCGLAAPEQECEIARIVRVAAKPTHTRIHCGGSLRAATPRIGRANESRDWRAQALIRSPTRRGNHPSGKTQ